MSPKILLVAFVIAILLFPISNYEIKDVQAQPSISIKVISKYPAPHNTTFWVNYNAPLYYDAATGTPVYDMETGYIIVQSLGGFSGIVSFSHVPVDSWPAGLQVSLPPPTFLPSGGTLTLSFNITVVSLVSIGSYAFIIRATSNSLTSDSNIASVVATSATSLFRLKGYPYIVATAAGTTIEVPVLIISQSGYVGTVALSSVYLGDPIPFNPSGFTISFDSPDPIYTGGLLKSHGIFEGRLKIGIDSGVSPSVYYVYVIGYYSDYIFNGDFALAKKIGTTLYPLGWNYTQNVELVTSQYFTYPYSARLIAPTASYSGTVRLYQKVWLPSTSPSYVLSAWYQISTSDTPGHDVVRFRIYNTTNYLLYEDVIPSANYNAGWVSYWVDLAAIPSVMAYRGKDIIISFEVVPDADSLSTTLYLDSIRLPGYTVITSVNVWYFFGINVRVVDMLVTQTQPSLPPEPLVLGTFEAFPLGSLPPASLTIGGPTPPAPYEWQGKANTGSLTYSPPTYQWFVGIVTTDYPSSTYDRVYEGVRAARIGATPNHPTSGFYHIWGWEILRYGPITIPNILDPLELQFYMYTDSQEGSAGGADFWDPTYVTFRSIDTSESPFTILPGGSDCSIAVSLPCYYTINSAASWQNWALYKFTIPDWMKGYTVYISIEMVHRDPLFRTWHIIDNFGIFKPGIILQDITLIGGAFRVTGRIGPNENVNTLVTGEGYYGGNVHISASISPTIPFTSEIFAQGPVGNLLFNGDFELGTLEGWDWFSDVVRATPPVAIVQNYDPLALNYDPNVISGRYSVKILYDTNVMDIESAGYTTLFTTVPVYISPYATSATLSFKYKTAIPPDGIIFDWFVEIINANTNQNLATIFLPLPTTTVTTITIDLTPYKGNNLIFRFRLGELTLTGVRAVYLDDVIINAPTPSIDKVFIADATEIYPFDAIISLPIMSLGSSPAIPPGIYNLTLKFEADPPYAPAVEKGAKGPVKTLMLKIRIVGVEPIEVPQKITTNGEFEFKLRFKTASNDNLNRTLFFETYDVWVSSTSYETGIFTPFDRATAAKEFGIWLKQDGDVNRKFSIELPGKGGSSEVMLRLITQNAKPGIYYFRFFITSNITAPGAIPSTLWIYNPPPPPGNWLYREFVGTPFDIEFHVGDYTISTDTYTIVIHSTGSAEFDVKVKTFVMPFNLSFSGKAYRIELGEVREVRGVSFEFEPETINLGADSEATIRVRVTTNLAPLGISYIDIIATDGITTRVIQGIKLIIVAEGGSLQEMIGSKNQAKPLSYGESIIKKLPTYEFSDSSNNNKIVNEYKPINLPSDNIREIQVISGYATLSLNAIVLVIATLAAIGLAVFITRKYL